MKNAPLVLLLSLFALVVLGAPQTTTPAADATGVWLATDVPYAPWVFELKQSGGTLTGLTWQSGAVLTVANVYEGVVKEDEISFKVNGGTGGTISFKGTRTGDTIVFTRTPSQAGTVGDGLYGAAAVRSVKVTRMPPGSTPPSRPAGAPSTFAPASTANTINTTTTSVTPVMVTYKGMKVDVTSIQSRPDKDAIVESIQRQIDLIDADVTDPVLKEFFHSVPLVTAPNLSGADNAAYTATSKTVVLTTPSYSPEKPIILHELFHAYHDQKMPGGMSNADIDRLFQQAKSSGQFPANAYMLSNRVEYFAMMASVYMHGSAARDPFTRAAIKEKQPDCYDWLVKEFGPKS